MGEPALEPRDPNEPRVPAPPVLHTVEALPRAARRGRDLVVGILALVLGLGTLANGVMTQPHLPRNSYEAGFLVGGMVGLLFALLGASAIRDWRADRRPNRTRRFAALAYVTILLVVASVAFAAGVRDASGDAHSTSPARAGTPPGEAITDETMRDIRAMKVDDGVLRAPTGWTVDRSEPVVPTQASFLRDPFYATASIIEFEGNGPRSMDAVREELMASVRHLQGLEPDVDFLTLDPTIDIDSTSRRGMVDAVATVEGDDLDVRYALSLDGERALFVALYSYDTELPARQFDEAFEDLLISMETQALDPANEFDAVDPHA